MKILSRIEGDDQRIKEGLLIGLEKILKEQFNPDSNDENSTSSISLNKIKEMKDRLKLTGFTSFWSLSISKIRLRVKDGTSIGGTSGFHTDN